MAAAGAATNHSAAALPLDEEEDPIFLRRPRSCCCCLWIPSRSRPLPTSPEWWERIRAADRAAVSRHWWAAPLLKLREWSEIAAGPRWKNFIRRFNRGGARPASAGVGRTGSGFRYDPLSYALNFDGGNAQDEGSDEEDHGFRNFSARFAPARSVMEAPAGSAGGDGGGGGGH